nr:MAG TPA: hypothetical protein [Caudoviricetes sp.]
MAICHGKMILIPTHYNVYNIIYVYNVYGKLYGK